MGIFDSIKSAFSSKEDPGTDSRPVRDDEEMTTDQPTTPATGGEGTADARRPEKGQAEARTYTVTYGDTLWKVAEKMYGDGADYMRIFDANRNLLEDPDRIFPGQELVIPDLRE